jgi:hypothetical protein
MIRLAEYKGARPRFRKQEMQSVGFFLINQKFFGSFFQKRTKESISFLKKRNKKLLLLWASFDKRTAVLVAL